ncbi:MAG: hypothetical protein IJ727_03910 [Treponema sp.]|nr:hypothetical protein [Treponema sp.]
MRRTKFLTACVAMAFVAGMGFVSCADDDNEKKEQEITDTQDNSVSTDDIVFNILRDLCDLSNDDGEEELPSDWKNRQFPADIGTTLDVPDADPNERYVACESAEEAEAYFHNLIGCNEDSWSDDDAGSFTFSKKNDSADEDLFATLSYR